MCFVPHLRALVAKLTSQKCLTLRSTEVVLTFLLPQALCATAMCTFSASQLPKLLREWNVWNILASKSASRDNGLRFFISHLPRWLLTHRFSEPTFRPAGATTHWKNTVFLSIFSRTCIFFLLTRSLLWSSWFFFLSLLWLFPPLLLHLSIMSEVWLPNFLRSLTYTSHTNTIKHIQSKSIHARCSLRPWQTNKKLHPVRLNI